jgi:hypothetical protein
VSCTRREAAEDDLGRPVLECVIDGRAHVLPLGGPVLVVAGLVHRGAVVVAVGDRQLLISGILEGGEQRLRLGRGCSLSVDMDHPIGGRGRQVQSVEFTELARVGDLFELVPVGRDDIGLGIRSECIVDYLPGEVPAAQCEEQEGQSDESPEYGPEYRTVFHGS